MTRSARIGLSLLAVLALFYSSRIALAQSNPTPVNPSYSRQSKFQYGRFVNNLEIDGNLQFNPITGNQFSITAPVPGQNTTLTIPDPGASTANLLLDAGTTGAVTIQHVAVPLTSANILAMYATPVQLIAAGAAGTNIIVHKVMLTMTTTATQYAGGGVVVFQIGNTANGAGTATTATIAAAVINAAAGTSYTTVIPVSYTGTSATGLFISNQTAAFTTGTGTGIVDIWYSIK